ncbi:MAG: hypothetical protein K2K33_04990, partial [Muribaculaceae bacterium]|nr:hypothetical protein [Muribaculaceae bacterium]
MRQICILSVFFLSLTVWAERPDTLSLARMSGEELRDARLKESHKIVTVGDGPSAPADSVRRMVEFFYYDQFRHFQDPLAPYFMFMSKDAKLAMGLG